MKGFISLVLTLLLVCFWGTILFIVIALSLAFTPVGFLGTFCFLGAFVLYDVLNYENDRKTIENLEKK